MKYIISDIHGCFEEYKMLLEELALTEEDEVFILGDSTDRGKEPINVLKDIMNRSNFTYILGNHDVMMLECLSFLTKEITEESIKALEKNERLHMAFGDWMNNGGEITLQKFLELERFEQEDILSFLKESMAYETIEYNDKLYILVHSGLGNFSPEKELDEYSIEDFIFERTDYKRNYFNSDRIFLVTGHTPVQTFREDKLPIVYTENNHIAVDCGCVFGGKLAAYCIETGESTYVDYIKS